MLSLINLSAVLNSATNVEVNNSLSNLLNENYTPNLSVTMTDNNDGTNKFDISFNSELIMKRNETSNNVSLVSNFTEVPVIGILTANIEETIQQGLFEVIQTKNYRNEVEKLGIEKEFISYIQKNTKDYFYILDNKTSELQLLRIYTMYISTSIGIYTDSKAVRNARKSKKDK